MTNATKYLTECGVRPSVQRIAVFEYVLTHATHPTVEEITDALLPRIPTLSKTTVYNTLKMLVESGAIDAIHIDRNCERYDANTRLHGHFMCDRCGKIIDTVIDDTENIIQYAPVGCEVRKAQVLYHGLCPECRKKK